MSAYTTQPFFSGFAELASSLANAPSVYREARTRAEQAEFERAMAERRAAQQDRQIGQTDRQLGQTDTKIDLEKSAQEVSRENALVTRRLQQHEMFQRNPNLAYARTRVENAANGLKQARSTLNRVLQDAARPIPVGEDGKPDQAEVDRRNTEYDNAVTAIRNAETTLDTEQRNYDRMGEGLASAYGIPWVKGEFAERPTGGGGGGGGGGSKLTLRAPPTVPPDAQKVGYGPDPAATGADLTRAGLMKRGIQGIGSGLRSAYNKISQPGPAAPYNVPTMNTVHPAMADFLRGNDGFFSRMFGPAQVPAPLSQSNLPTDPARQAVMPGEPVPNPYGFRSSPPVATAYDDAGNPYLMLGQ